MKAKHCIVIFLIWILGFICVFSNAQTPESTQKKSEWIENATIDIPYNIEINKGVTKSNNPKYSIDIEDITVYVSPSNYEKFIKKEVVLVLVEWYNPTTGKYKYTTRQKAKTQLVKKLNLNELW
jgi:hypothetical protein